MPEEAVPPPPLCCNHEEKSLTTFAKRFLFFLLGCVGLLSLIFSISAACVTNEALLKEGFTNYAEARHLGVSPTAYDDYAHAIAQQLKGQAETARIPDPDAPGMMKNAFSDKENRHLTDVRGIVKFMVLFRYIGGGAVLAALLLMYLLGREKRGALFIGVWRGFAAASAFLLMLAAALGVWGAVNFGGLFWAFHKLAFTNDLWLLDPRTDVLVALMPQGFFVWYGKLLLRNLLPIVGVMLCLLVSWLRLGRKETEKTGEAPQKEANE